MIYLQKFKLLDESLEYSLLTSGERRCIYNSVYPLKIFTSKSLKTLEFADITIFYGSNGSGKTTLLNIIAEKLGATRKNKLDNGAYFSKYVDYCKMDMSYIPPVFIDVLSSDDVFDYLLNIRCINAHVSNRKEALSREYMDYKFGNICNSFDKYEELKKEHDASRQSLSAFVRERLGNNTIIQNSNGETSLMFWEREIKEKSLYILDEPENSLSPENVLKLKKFIEDSARYYDCQFIISTHSPFLLKLAGAKIYNLDKTPACLDEWSNLPGVKVYYDFFKQHQDEFEE